jgi:hypothetical protein
MYHPRLKGTHYAMGQKMVNIFKRCNVKFPIRLDPFQMEFGKKSGMILKQFFPEAAEIKGITDVLGYTNELFSSWLLCMGCCLDIDWGDPTEVRGCTAFSFEYNNQVCHGRNNDLSQFLKKTSKNEYYEPENKNSSNYLRIAAP